MRRRSGFRMTVAALLAFCALPVSAAGARIEGLLLDVDGKAAAGHTLHLIDGDGNGVGTAPTSEEGIYSFIDLPPGSYSLAVEDSLGRIAVVDAPPMRLGKRTLARRDLRLMQADAETHTSAASGKTPASASGGPACRPGRACGPWWVSSCSWR